MRNTDDRRAVYYQSRSKALAQADTPAAIEAVRLQAEAVATVTDWSEYSELADEATRKLAEMDETGDRETASGLPADQGDVNHE